MKRRRFVTFALAAALFGGLGWAALRPGQAHADGGGDPGGSTYLTTITDSQTGAFSSRSVISFHDGGTISVEDSNQGALSFSSQLGAWEPAGDHGIVARTLDFSYPPPQGIARADYTATVQGAQVSGQIVLRTFPLLGGDPLKGPGTVVGKFAFVGQRLTAN